MARLPVDETWKKVENEAIRKICVEFNDTFLLEGDKLTQTIEVMHHMPTQLGHPPINKRIIRLAEKHKTIISSSSSSIVIMNP